MSACVRHWLYKLSILHGYRDPLKKIEDQLSICTYFLQAA